MYQTVFFEWLRGVKPSAMGACIGAVVGLITGSPDLFLKHLAALGLVSGLTFGGSWLLYRLTDLITPLRVEECHEQLGLDLSQHGETMALSGRGDALQQIEVFQHLTSTAND